jgi:hypothetical protein
VRESAIVRRRVETATLTTTETAILEPRGVAPGRDPAWFWDASQNPAALPRQWGRSDRVAAGSVRRERLGVDPSRTDRAIAMTVGRRAALAFDRRPGRTPGSRSRQVHRHAHRADERRDARWRRGDRVLMLGTALFGLALIAGGVLLTLLVP